MKNCNRISTRQHVTNAGRTRFAQLPAVATALALAALLPGAVHAGNGHFDSTTGQFDFCVSLRFDATPTQIAMIQGRFQQASQILADATDNQHRFGKVTIVNNKGASQTADYWIKSGDFGAYATMGKFGVRGQHITMSFDRYFKSSASELSTENAYTVAHEFAHHAYGVLDEYSGPSGTAECAPVAEEAVALSYCFMDNFKSRGGQAGGGTTHTLNEFCVSSNHDPDADTSQESKHGKSCWEVIAAHPTRPATAPTGLPTSAAPTAHTVTFATGIVGLRAVQLIDRSGSMSAESKLVFAKLGAQQFVDVMDTGDSIGVSSFATTPSTEFALTTITGASVKNAAKVAIDNLVASGSTNIGGGLLTALSQITSKAERSCNEVIVLLSDGDHNTGTEPTAAVIDMLSAQNVTVFTVGLGTGLSTSGEATLQSIAMGTGGKFYRVISAADLVALQLEVAMESKGSGLLVADPEQIAAGATVESTVLLEPGIDQSTFAIVFADASDELTMTLRDPGGGILSIPSSQDSNSQVFVVDNPQPGTWHVVTTAATVNTGTYEVLAFAVHDGVQLNVDVAGGMLTAPEPILIEATPTYEGESVVGVVVSGSVLRPDGTEVGIALMDDGQPTSGDAVAGDGTYASRFDIYTENGTYTVELTAANSTGTTYLGEESEVLPGDTPTSVPPFQRSGSASVVVFGVTGLVCGFSSYGVAPANVLSLSGLGSTSVGSTVEFVTSGAPATSLVQTVLSYGQVQLPLLGGGIVLIDSNALRTSFQAPVVSGVATQRLALPSNPTLVGVELFFQSFALDPSQPTGFALSNGLRLEICP